METKDVFPSVSIVIPARNEEATIGNCLQSLKALYYPPEKLEIIVVDNGSQDRTYEIALQYDVKVVKELTIFTAAAARNRGILEAHGEIMAFIDADAVADPFWIKNAVICMTRTGADIVGGAILPLYSASPSWSEIYEILFAYDQEKFVNQLHFSASCNMIVKSKVFSRVGLFDPNLRWSEDLEWGQRAYRAGAKIVYCPEAKVYHVVRKTWKELADRAWKEGYYEVQKCLKEKKGFMKSLRWRFLLSPGLRTIIRKTRQKGYYRFEQITMMLLIHNALKFPRLMGILKGIQGGSTT